MFGKKKNATALAQESTPETSPKKKRGCLTTFLIVFIALIAIGIFVPSESEREPDSSQGSQSRGDVSEPVNGVDEPSTDPAVTDNTQANDTVEEPEPKPEPEQKPAAKTKKEKAFEEGIEVDWQTVRADYQNNAIAADSTYKGKNLIVTGEVFDIGREVMQHPYVTFSSDGYIGTFQMVFKNDEESLIAGLSKGDTITVVGECKGQSLGVIILLDNCYLQVSE